MVSTDIVPTRNELRSWVSDEQNSRRPDGIHRLWFCPPWVGGMESGSDGDVALG